MITPCWLTPPTTLLLVEGHKLSIPTRELSRIASRSRKKECEIGQDAKRALYF